MATGINAGESNTGSGTARDRLKTFITRWQGIRDAISDLNDRIERSRTGESLDKLEPLERRLRELQESRRDIVDNIQGIVGNKPGLYDEAVKWGFRSDLLPGGGDADSPSGVNAGEQKAGGGGEGGTTGGGGGGKTSGSTGGGGGGKGGGGGGTGLGSRERLKNFKLVRLPSGRVMAVRTINVRGNKVQWGVWVDKADFDKYGVNEKKISSITKAQARKIEAMGNADELVFRGDDKNEFKAIVRGITRAHKGSPILDNDEVLGIIVAQSALGLTDSETQGLLKQTRWYKRSTDHEQVWTLDYSPEKRREDIKNMRIRLVDELEDLYGLDWQKHVDGGMKKVRTWAQRIASGELGGDPSAGLDRWMRNQFDKAAEIEGTPAWMQRQSEAEEVAKWHNRPEEMFERLRSETLAYLGYDKNNTPRIDRGSLKQWAGQLVSGEKSEGDWAQFLRNQMKTLFPYFDPNIAFTDQASAYKSIAERTLGDTLDWNDRLLRDFSRLNNNGEPTGNAMSLHDFEMKVRADKRARREGSGIWQEGEQFAQGLAQVFKGVT